MGRLIMVELAITQTETLELRVKVHQFTRKEEQELLHRQRSAIVGFPTAERAHIHAADLGGGLDRETRADEAQITQGTPGDTDR